MRKKRIVIIGLDGANKTTAKLVGVKKTYDFISTIPPYTPPSWTSIFTGVNPAKHGIIGWQKVDLENNKVGLFTSKDVKSPRLSEILDRANLKSIVINLPMTYPFEGIKSKENTIIVSDWAAPEQAMYPKKMEQKYKEQLVDPPHEWAKDNKSEYPRRVKEYTETRLNIYYDLLEREDWNLYFIVFSEIDWFSHIFPQILEGKNTHIVAPTLRLIKEFIETTKSMADYVFIVSDHGFEVKNKVFYVNEALAKAGFIKYSKTKSTLINTLRTIIPEKILSKIITKTGRSMSSISYITQKADAFVVEPASWGVYLRDKSRTPEVIKELKRYKEIFDVIEFKALHKGPHTKYMPELLIIPEKGVEFSHELREKLTENIYRGDHELHGVFSVCGNNISDDIQFRKLPRVYDVVPTVLDILGIPSPRKFDGRILEEIFVGYSDGTKDK